MVSSFDLPQLIRKSIVKEIWGQMILIKKAKVICSILKSSADWTSKNVRAGTKQPTVAGSMNQKMGRDLKPGSRQHDQPTAIQFTIISSPSL